MWILSTINKKYNHCRHFLSKLGFNYTLISVRCPQSIFYTFLSAIFVRKLQKSHLNRKIIFFRLFSIVWMSPNFLRFFPNFSPNFHCFHMDGNCYNEPQIAVGHFKKYFKYTLYIIISMNIVIYSSKDWPFNQILACLWSFLSISAFVSIIFCNFAVKQQ